MALNYVDIILCVVIYSLRRIQTVATVGISIKNFAEVYNYVTVFSRCGKVEIASYLKQNVIF